MDGASARAKTDTPHALGIVVESPPLQNEPKRRRDPERTLRPELEGQVFTNNTVLRQSI